MSKESPGRPFNGDIALLSSIDTLIESFGVRTIIETGTHKGDTARWLATKATTHTIEINPERHREARRTLAGLENLTLHNGSSQEVIASLLPRIESPSLFYLDAHWGKYWPLLDEIRAISPLKDTIIVIHDFKVPGVGFGFDSYGGRDLDIEYIAPTLDAHFSHWRYWHNRVASGAMRGVCFILTGEFSIQRTPVGSPTFADTLDPGK